MKKQINKILIVMVLGFLISCTSLNSKENFIKHLTNGHAEIEKENFQKSIDEYTKAIEIGATDFKLLSFVYFERGAAKMSLKKNKEALLDFEKAISLEPDNSNYYFAKSSVESLLEEHEKALKDCSLAIKMSKEINASYYELCGMTRVELGKYNEALKDFDIAIAKEPKNPMYYFKRGSVNVLLNNYKSGLKDLNKAIEIEEKALFYLTRCNIYYNLGKIKESEEDYNRAKFLDPVEVEKYFNVPH